MNTRYHEILLKSAWILGTTFLGILTLLHFIKPEIDPTYRLISEYEIGQYGWMMRLAFFCWGGGFLCLIVSVWSDLKSWGGKIGKWWLLLLSFALFGAGIFVTQPITDIVRGSIDRYHATCGALMIFTFPVVSSIIAYNLSKNSNLKSIKIKFRLVTILVWLGFIAFLVSMTIYAPQIKLRDYSSAVYIGFPNRFMVVSYTIWLIVIARHFYLMRDKKD